MNDTYKGESVGKKFARFDFWATALTVLGAPHGGRFVVLASREGGDLSVLSGFGIDPLRVVAVDRRADAVRQCKERWPDAVVVQGEVEQFVDRTTDAVFLDFCGPLGAANLATSVECIDRLRIGSLCGIEILKGRENDTPLPLAWQLPNNRAFRRMGSSLVRTSHGRERAILKSALGIENFSARDFVHRLEGAMDGDGDLATRFAPIHFARPDLETIGMWQYQSAVNGSNGVPMAIALFRKSRRRSIREIRRGINDLPRHGRLVLEKEVSDLRAFVLHLASIADREGADGTAIASLLMATPRGTINAWKAHATRGTYDAAAP